MDSREQQLILDLASGSLPEEEVRAAEASLSDEGRRELAAHRLFLGAVAQAEQPVMTDLERTRLHRGVTEGISEITRELDVTPVAVTAPRRARTIRWMRFASAAAAAAVLVGVVAVGTQLQGGSDEDAVAALAPDTTFAAGATDATSAPAEGVEADDQLQLAGDATREADAPVQTTTSMAQAFRPLQAPSVEAGTEESDLEELARFLTATSEIDAEALAGLACFDVASDAVDLALAAVETQPDLLVKGFTLMYRDRAAVGFQSQAVDDEEAIRIYDAVTCEELATAPR